MTIRGSAPADGVTRATGRSRAEWFALLDEWAGSGRAYREIAGRLVGEHGLSAWWAQKLTVEYQEARGVRPAGVRRDGTFEVGASKVVAAGADELERAFLEPAIRGRWLPGLTPRRLTERHGVLQFEWRDGPSRVTVQLQGAGGAKTLVAVRHDRIADAETAKEHKAYWRDRLEALKALLEA